MAKEMRQIADRHNCTVSYVISHFLTDFLSETKEITEISAESLLNFQRTNHICLSKKMVNHLPEFRSLGKLKDC
jgi:hypothetical protein